MTSALAILITKGDDHLNRIFQILEGALERTTYRSSKNLSGITGEDGGPLVLLGHANAMNFIVDRTGWSQYESGSAVVSTLLESRDLKAPTFGFALLAGCKGAEQVGRNGLFVEVGDGLGIPVIASTTPVAMGQQGTQVTFTPQDGGQWKVYVPSEGTVYGLSATRFTGSDFVGKLASASILLQTSG